MTLTGLLECGGVGVEGVEEPLDLLSVRAPVARTGGPAPTCWAGHSAQSSYNTADREPGQSTPHPVDVIGPMQGAPWATRMQTKC